MVIVSTPTVTVVVWETVGNGVGAHTGPMLTTVSRPLAWTLTQRSDADAGAGAAKLTAAAAAASSKVRTFIVSSRSAGVFHGMYRSPALRRRRCTPRCATHTARPGDGGRRGAHSRRLPALANELGNYPREG